MIAKSYLSCPITHTRPWDGSTKKTNLCKAQLTEPGLGHFVYWCSVAVWSSHLSTNRMRFCFFQSKCVVIVSLPFDLPTRAVAASYPDVSLLMKMCAQRKAGRTQRSFACFPWSLAVHHQSLAFRARLARLCHAKNEAPEEEAGAVVWVLFVSFCWSRGRLT